jgi:hypothetical protein
MDFHVREAGPPRWNAGKQSPELQNPLRLQHWVAVRCGNTETKWSTAGWHAWTVNSKFTKRMCNIPENFNLQHHRCKNLKYSKCVTYWHDETDFIAQAKYTNVKRSWRRARASLCVCYFFSSGMVHLDIKGKRCTVAVNTLWQNCVKRDF